jgi:hypothetical protein
MATYFLFGEPDFYATLFYLLLFSFILGSAVFVVWFIYVKVFRGGREGILTINPDGVEERKR